jgi:hypothetical protein
MLFDRTVLWYDLQPTNKSLSILWVLVHFFFLVDLSLSDPSWRGALGSIMVPMPHLAQKVRGVECVSLQFKRTLILTHCVVLVL